MFFPQVVVALAAAGHSLQQFKGSSPKASVIFCSSEGAIVVYDIAFDAKAERTWGKIVPQVAAFYTEKLLKKLAELFPTIQLVGLKSVSPHKLVSIHLNGTPMEKKRTQEALFLPLQEDRVTT